jgi:hypothetical protein
MSAGRGEEKERAAAINGPAGPLVHHRPLKRPMIGSGRPVLGAGNEHFARGVVLSVEALLAALLLFGILLLAGTLLQPIRPPPSPLLEDYAQDLLQAGAETGAWLGPAGNSPNDSAARALIEALPPALCAQAELYANNTSSASMRWAYVRSGCGLAADTPLEQRWGLVVWRANSSYSIPYWVRVRAYPKGE